MISKPCKAQAARQFLTFAFVASLTAAPAWSQTAPIGQPNAASPAKKTETVPPTSPAETKAPLKKEVQVEPPAGTATGSGDGETIMLSPFEVVGDNKGYMATNSASGTRLNSRLEDLASPISVVTKQQLQDMAAVDLNDIFRSEANVEGFYQYTEFSIDNNRIIDTASNNPESNNRIRGMGQANITAGGMSVSSGTPIDTYNIDSVEISRGANSNIFGIGSNSGTVNLNLASGNMTRDNSKVSFQTDDRGRLRETFDFNRVILRNKLAFRVLGVHDDVGFIREPSSQITKRFTFAARAQPFRKTSIKFSYETFRNKQSLPNAMTPREAITSWKDAGAYTWDASTGTLYNGAGTAVGTYSGAATGAGSAQELRTNFRFVGGSLDTNFQRPTIGYINGDIAYLTGTSSWQFSSRNATTLVNTYNQTGNQRLVNYELPGAQIYVSEINPATGQPFGLVNSAFSEQASGINGEAGKALYDWTEYNINAANSSERKTNTTRFELEQFVINSGNQQLAFQLAGLVEDVEAKSWNFIGNGGDGVDGVLFIDVNRTLPNGQTNPGYLRPSIRGRGAQVYYRPEESKTYKAQGAYMIDFTQNKGISKWLGRHNFVGYGEFRERKNIPNSLRYTNRIADGSNLTRALGNSDSFNTLYYLGDGTGLNVDSPTTRPPTTTVTPYTYWSTEFGPTGNVLLGPAQWRTDNVQLAEPLSSFQGPLKTEIRSMGAVWQGFFLDGRVIPTIGYREDRVRFAGRKPLPVPQYTIGNAVYQDPVPVMFDFSDTYNIVNPQGGNVNKGTTRTNGVVVKPLSWLHLTYNQSDSLDPATQAVDTYGTLLDNPRGKSKDYGVRVSMLNERLWISLNKYESEVINARNGGTGRVAARVIPFDFDVGQADIDNAFGATSANELDLFDWYYVQIYGNSSTPTGVGQLPRPPNFEGSGDSAYMTQNNLFGATDIETRARVTNHVIGLMGFTREEANAILNAPAGAQRTATNDITSKGYELEINYRTKFWNVKVTGAQKETIDSNIAASLTRYVTERMPILEAATYTNRSTNITNSYWLTTTGGASPSTRQNQYNGQVLSLYLPLVQNAGKPRPQIRKYSAALTTSYALAGISDNSIIKSIRVGGGGSWVSTGAIGTKYATPELNSDGTYTIRKIDPSFLYYDKARYTANIWASYDFKLLSGRIKSSIQLNVQNLMENGRLQVVSTRTDGTPWAYRIIDPRLYQLTLNLEL